MISASTFIRNNMAGFCLWESVASWLPFVDEMVIVDLGSTDGTLKLLERVSAANPKIRLFKSEFSCIDAKAFADAANQGIEQWSNPVGLFWQADEIPHQNLLKLFDEKLKAGVENLAFWRYQTRENFQKIKWFPHPVHRLGKKADFKFVGDGMNSDKVFGVDVCSNYNMGWFTRWGKEFENKPTELPVNEMLLDVSMVGAFRDNIPERRALHAPMWHESVTIEDIPVDEWIAKERKNPNWVAKTSPFDLPEIMKWHIGETTYGVRGKLIEAICDNDTKGFLGL